MRYGIKRFLLSFSTHSSCDRYHLGHGAWRLQSKASKIPLHLRMTTPANKAVLSPIRGAELKRFVVHAALLYLIDPVRGEPTRTAVDEDPDGINSGGQRLKKNFLDSFALICSTSASGAETASAVCLEQHAAAGAVLRVARNRGLTPPVLNGLEGVLQLLRVVSRKGTCFTLSLCRLLTRPTM